MCISFHFICTDQSRRYFYVPCDNYQTIKTINCDDTIKAQGKGKPATSCNPPGDLHPHLPRCHTLEQLPRCGQVLSLRCACLFFMKREGEGGEVRQRSTRTTSKGAQAEAAREERRGGAGNKSLAKCTL